MKDGYKEYLGDGVYARAEVEGIWLTLTTENGVDVQNEILLDAYTYAKLVAFADRYVDEEPGRDWS